jgi:hypothetical protein
VNSCDRVAFIADHAAQPSGHGRFESLCLPGLSAGAEVVSLNSVIVINRLRPGLAAPFLGNGLCGMCLTQYAVCLSTLMHSSAKMRESVDPGCCVRASKDYVHLCTLWAHGTFVAGLHELKVEHGHSPRFRRFRSPSLPLGRSVSIVPRER